MTLRPGLVTKEQLVEKVESVLGKPNILSNHDRAVRVVEALFDASTATLPKEDWIGPVHSEFDTTYLEMFSDKEQELREAQEHPATQGVYENMLDQLMVWMHKRQRKSLRKGNAAVEKTYARIIAELDKLRAELAVTLADAPAVVSAEPELARALVGTREALPEMKWEPQSPQDRLIRIATDLLVLCTVSSGEAIILSRLVVEICNKGRREKLIELLTQLDSQPVFEPFAEGPEAIEDAQELGRLLNCPPYVGNILDRVKEMLEINQQTYLGERIGNQIFRLSIPGGMLRIYHLAEEETTWRIVALNAPGCKGMDYFLCDYPEQWTHNPVEATHYSYPKGMTRLGTLTTAAPEGTLNPRLVKEN